MSKETESAGRGQTTPPLKTAPARADDLSRSADATEALRSAHARHRSSDQRGKPTLGRRDGD
jgi:hypothetical protein